MIRKVCTAAELEMMDPFAVDVMFVDSIIRNPAAAPLELLARTRERILRRIEETEPTQRP